MSISKRIKILVISEGNTAKDPRPKRVIENFKSSCLVTTIGINVSDIEDVNVLSYPASKRRSFFREILLYINIFTRRYMQLVDIPSRKKIQIFMQEESYDVIFCHSLVLLPLVLKYKKNAKVIFDAREYYPKEQEHNYRWRILFKNFNHWLCKTYLPLVDYVYSVSKGLSQQYEYDYNISCNTIMSLPAFYDIKPSKIEKKIKLIYHGVASEDRYIHLMIEMMDYVDDRFQLDLMLMGKGSDYYNYLCNKIKKRKSIRIIPPVEFDNIVPFTNTYDIGLYILPPSNFNTKHALPNKFFEFIQARLAVAIGPSIEMQEIVSQYDLGIIAKDFTPKMMATMLNKLTLDELKRYKNNTSIAAKILNRKITDKEISKIVKELI